MKRDRSIDFGKTICLVLVVFAHSCGFPFVLYYFSTFYMMFFFFASGYLQARKEINDCNGLNSVQSGWSFGKKKFFKLLKSYFIINFILLSITSLIKMIQHRLSIDFVVTAIIGILYGRLHIATEKIFFVCYNSAMWFIPCFAIALLIKKRLDFITDKYLSILLYSLCLILGYLLSIMEISIPWSLDIALIGVFIMRIGEVIKMYHPVYNKMSVVNKGLLFLTGVFLIIVLTDFNGYSNTSLSMWGRNIFIYLIISVLGSILLLLLGMTVGKLNIIAYMCEKIVKSSIILLGFHRIIIDFIAKIESFIFGYNRHFGIIGIINVIITILLCVLIKCTLDKMNLKRGRNKI